MAQVNKIDSNITGLRYAVETSLGVLGGSPVWKPLEPNSYNDFGGQLTTIARNPINPSRQRKKGVVTDLDASGGFNMDLTQTNLQEILQGFMFANFREKFDSAPFNGTAITITAVDGPDDQYEAASGLDDLRVGDLVLASGFTNADNNGLKSIASVAAGAVDVNEDLVEEVAPPAAARLVHVGFEFDSAEVNIDVSTGSLPRLVRVGAVAASSVLTLSDQPENGEEIVIGDVTYTYVTALSAGPTVPYEILIGGNVEASLDNATAAITGAAGVGTTYSIGTVAHPLVTAVNGSATLTVTALEVGESGNAIVVSSDINDGDNFDADGTLQGGAGKLMTDFGLIPGEWVFVGGDAVSDQFDTEVNNGLKRVKSVTADYIEFDKSFATMANETGAGLTIRIFFGRVLKNETGEHIVRRSFQLERTLGAPNDSNPTDLQGEYLVGSVASELQMNINTADKVTVDLSFVSTDNQQVTASAGLKNGSRPSIVESDAFNTSSDFARIKIAQVVAGEEAPAALFAYATEATVTVNNNVSPNKAVSVLGAFDVTAGTFAVSGSITAYFANIEAVQAVRNNADITLDFHLVKANAGISIDIPLLSLGDGRANIEQDQPITLPLTMEAATGAKNDANMDHTLLMVFFDYLPDLAG